MQKKKKKWGLATNMGKCLFSDFKDSLDHSYLLLLLLSPHFEDPGREKGKNLPASGCLQHISHNADFSLLWISAHGWSHLAAVGKLT